MNNAWSSQDWVFTEQSYLSIFAFKLINIIFIRIETPKESSVSHTIRIVYILSWLTSIRNITGLVNINGIMCLLLQTFKFNFDFCILISASLSEGNFSYNLSFIFYIFKLWVLLDVANCFSAFSSIITDHSFKCLV